MKISMMSMMLAAKYTPQEIVQAAVKCRMDGIDWVTEHNSRASDLKKMCDDAALPVIAHTPIIDLPKWTVAGFLDQFRYSLDFALELQAPVMMIPTCKLGYGSRELDRAKWLEALAEAAPMAKKAGTILTFEAMGFYYSPVQSAAECLQLLDAIPDLQLTFDSGNVETVENPIISYSKLADRTVHAHFKDCTIVPRDTPGALPGIDGTYHVWKLLNEGDSDFKTLWNCMKAHGYQGYVNFESESPDMPIIEAMQKMCDQMRDW